MVLNLIYLYPYSGPKYLILGTVQGHASVWSSIDNRTELRMIGPWQWGWIQSHAASIQMHTEKNQLAFLDLLMGNLCQHSQNSRRSCSTL